MHKSCNKIVCINCWLYAVYRDWLRANKQAWNVHAIGYISAFIAIFMLYPVRVLSTCCGPEEASSRLDGRWQVYDIQRVLICLLESIIDPRSRTLPLSNWRNCTPISSFLCYPPFDVLITFHCHLPTHPPPGVPAPPAPPPSLRKCLCNRPVIMLWSVVLST